MGGGSDKNQAAKQGESDELTGHKTYTPEPGEPDLQADSLNLQSLDTNPEVEGVNHLAGDKPEPTNVKLTENETHVHVKYCIG